MVYILDLNKSNFLFVLGLNLRSNNLRQQTFRANIGGQRLQN